MPSSIQLLSAASNGVLAETWESNWVDKDGGGGGPDDVTPPSTTDSLDRQPSQAFTDRSGLVFFVAIVLLSAVSMTGFTPSIPR
jgi:hypothetical protein